MITFREIIGATDRRPCAVLFRQIATPNYEMRSFLRSSRRRRLTPIICTFERDMFCVHNLYKRSLLTPLFLRGVSRQGSPIWQRCRLTDQPIAKRSPLSDIQIDGRGLVDVHRAVLDRALPDDQYFVIDISDWLLDFADGPKEYYYHILAGLHSGTILCDQFDTNPAEIGFYADIVEPAIARLVSETGCTPPILPLTRGKHAASPLWYGYPAGFRDYFSPTPICHS